MGVLWIQNEWCGIDLKLGSTDLKERKAIK
jgi:hypothetical protein